MGKKESKDKAEIRINDSEEFLKSARENLDKGRYKASLDHSVDASIAANDAFTIYFIEEVASTDHQEAIKLHKLAGKKISENKANEIALLLEERHRKSYRCVPVTRNTAEIDFKKASRFLEWVKSIIKDF